MFSVLKNKTYRNLLTAQVVALIGTGLATVALGLLAFDLAGDNAGQVLGIALMIKMFAFIFIAPIATAFTNHIPRKTLLITLDIVRASVAVFLPFVTEIWQIYVCVFVLQAASAGFTPVFQAVIPEILPKEDDYTKALSLSRLAYDLESLASPTIAAILLTIVSYNNLFMGTSLGFLLSSLMILLVTLPQIKQQIKRDAWDRISRGTILYLSTPRLRGLLSLNLAAAAAGSIIIVNTIILVQSVFKLNQTDTAMALAAFGCGSMVVAFLLPKILEKYNDRTIMFLGAEILLITLIVSIFLSSYTMLIILWFCFGIGYSLVLTPSGRLIRRSADSDDLPALFASQFASSHLCWLLTYPLAGFVGNHLGLPMTFGLMAVISFIAIVLGKYYWTPKGSLQQHSHPDLPENHPHILAHTVNGVHQHVYNNDDVYHYSIK